MNLSPNRHSPFNPGCSWSHLKRIAARLLLALALAPLSAAGQEQRAEPVQVEALRLDGTRYSLADSRGAITVVSVWSPESIASRKCIGELQRFATMYQERGIKVIAISTIGDADQLQRFAAQRELTIPLATMGETNLGPFYNHELPQLYVFDRDGKLKGTHRGLYRLRILEQLVAPLL